MKAGLVVLFLLVAAYQVDGIIEDLLKKCKCSEKEVCRVIRGCDLGQKFEGQCLNCVPKDLDQHCRDHGYLRTVLVGNPKDTSSISPMGCVETAGLCLGESFCVGFPGTKVVGKGRRGICCYDPMPIESYECSWGHLPQDLDACKCPEHQVCILELKPCGTLEQKCVPRDQ